MRIIDPRSNSIAKEFTLDVSSKGFQVVFMENSKLFTVGFSTKGTREISLWDYTNNKQMNAQTIDAEASILRPFYDWGTGIVYLAGRGNTIKLYEVNNEPPFAHFINNHTTLNTYSGVSILPKRMVEASQCEIARFLTLTGNNEVTTVSLYVPRKNADQLFQEDIFPPAPSGKPAITANEWLNGKSSIPDLKSMKPEGVVSVFDVGVKNREEEDKAREKRGNFIPTAVLEVSVPKKKKLTEGGVRW